MALAEDVLQLINENETKVNEGYDKDLEIAYKKIEELSLALSTLDKSLGQKSPTNEKKVQAFLDKSYKTIRTMKKEFTQAVK